MPKKRGDVTGREQIIIAIYIFLFGLFGGIVGNLWVAIIGYYKMYLITTFIIGLAGLSFLIIELSDVGLWLIGNKERNTISQSRKILVAIILVFIACSLIGFLVTQDQLIPLSPLLTDMKENVPFNFLLAIPFLIVMCICIWCMIGWFDNKRANDNGDKPKRIRKARKRKKS